MFMTFLQYLTSEFCGNGFATGDYDNIHKYKNNQMKFLQSDLKNRCSVLINQEYIYWKNTEVLKVFSDVFYLYFTNITERVAGQRVSKISHMTS